MQIGVVGLGLIGGSLAKAYKAAGQKVLGFDKDHLVTEYAKMAGAIDGELLPENYNDCECILIAIPPVPAAKWIEKNAPLLDKEALVIDCCGTKRHICKAGFEAADKYGFTYVGGHPMAGKQYGGIKHSSADLYKGAPFAIVPGDRNNIELLDRVRSVILPAGFGKIVMSTAEEHDKIIAFTSQMAHVVSNAFIKSETALSEGVSISAGSYKDFTRVAYLDANMWTELFMENRDNLKAEIDTLVEELSKYSKALENQDADRMRELLIEGREKKVEVDNRCNLKK